MLWVGFKWKLRKFIDGKSSIRIRERGGDMSRIKDAHDQLVAAIREETGFNPLVEIKLLPPKDEVPVGV